MKQSSSAARTKHFWFTMWSKLRMFLRLWMSMRIMFKKLSYDCTCLIDLRTVPPRNLHLRQGSFYTKNASRANSERIFGIKHIQNPPKFSACGGCKFKPRIFKTQCFWKNMSEMHFMSEISDLGQTGGGITQIQGVQCARPYSWFAATRNGCK